MKDTAFAKQDNPDAFCPSCERFIGPADVCPYCECDSARKPVFRFMMYGSVLLAVAGLFFLYLMAVHSDVPRVKIAEITPMMNFGLVRIEGVVGKDAFVKKKKRIVESVSFPVDDGSGELRVVAYGQVAKMLVESKLVPEGMTRVEVSGTLNVSADGNSRLVLRRAEELKMEKDKKDQGCSGTKAGKNHEDKKVL